jgi:hypothetical protein
MRAHLPQKSPQFGKKNEKLPMNMLQKKKYEFPKSEFPKPESPKSEFPKAESPKAEFPKPESPKSEFPKPVEVVAPSTAATGSSPRPEPPPEPKVEDVKIADLFVPLTSIKPGDQSEGVNVDHFWSSFGTNVVILKSKSIFQAHLLPLSHCGSLFCCFAGSERKINRKSTKKIDRKKK